ncbi:MAG TPA: class I SAM-dependent methyltransferase [Ktedonobacterales bacterium]
MRDEARRDTRQQMLAINVRQKDFYESRFEAAETSATYTPERAANVITNLWSRARLWIWRMRKVTGVDDQLYTLHHAWLGDLAGMRVLDLGCFSGNRLSLEIAERCGEYIGLDLSPHAIERLNSTLRERDLTHAHAYAGDFLANDFPDASFDLVYAFSVLHHFQDMGVLLDELARILKPGGTIISMDPLMTDPLNRLARLLYRPLQTDRAWEWPFTRATLRRLRRSFVIEDLQGVAGAAKIGLALQLLPGMRRIGQVVCRWGQRWDNRFARRQGLALYVCWWVSMRLRKPGGMSGDR